MVRASKRKAELSSPPPSEDAHPEEPQEESEEEQVSGEEVDPVRFPAAASSFGLQRTNETSEPPGSLPTHRRCSAAPCELRLLGWEGCTSPGGSLRRVEAAPRRV
jgi:hypothetical protein